MTHDVPLTANERRLLRNAMRRDASCPVIDREDVVTLLYKLERFESEARKK